jgi:hypothetical protein
MAFKKVTGSKRYVKYNECTPGQKLVSEGSYLGPYQGKYGVLHDFKEKGGEIACLNSSGQLNYLLETHVATGDVCNVYYKGKVLLSKGTFKGKEAHNFEIEVDDAKHSDDEPDAVAAVKDDNDIAL